MFMIFKNNRPAGNKQFTTFEQARQTLRKRLRKLTTARRNGQPASGIPWIPFSYTTLGYAIRKV